MIRKTFITILSVTFFALLCLFVTYPATAAGEEILKERQEALKTVAGYEKEARFHNVSIREIGGLIPTAEYNIPVIVRAAYLASKFGYHTKPLIDVAKLAASSDHEVKELNEIIDLVVLKLSGTLQVVRVAESAVNAKSDEEKNQVKQKIEKLKASADYKSIEEALKTQSERWKKEAEKSEEQPLGEQIFQKKIVYKEKYEALKAIEEYVKEAKFPSGSILEIAYQVPKAEYNIPVITRCAYLAATFGYHTAPLVDIAKLAASSDHEVKELYELAELDVMKLSESAVLLRIAESAVKAKSEEEKKQVRQDIEKFRATADYKSIEEALKAQDVNEKK